MRLGLDDRSWETRARRCADALLAVHRSYFRSVMPVIGRVHGLAHITGGGIPGNLVRVLPAGCEAVVDPGSWELPPLFASLQQAGRIATGEMRDVFNLGVGLIAVLPADALAAAQAAAQADGVADLAHRRDPRGGCRRALHPTMNPTPAIAPHAPADHACAHRRGDHRAGADIGVHRLRGQHRAGVRRRGGRDPGALIRWPASSSSGGNPVLGTAGTLGGLGHFSVTARVNAVHIGTARRGVYRRHGHGALQRRHVRSGAAGRGGRRHLHGGLPSGLLAIDALGSAQLLPTGAIDHLAVDGGARRIGDVALGLGFGARVGLLRELGPLPAVSVSVMRRDIPQLAYGDLDDGDEFRYAVDLHATNVRLVASKRLALLELAAGLGWDRYTGDAAIQFREQVGGTIQPEVPLELRSERVLGFLDAGLSLGLARLTGEVGWQGGKDQELSTDFEDFDETGGRFFAGLGLRVGF